MFERPQGGANAVLVHIDFSDQDEQEQLSEFLDLARSAGAEVAGLVTAARDAPDPSFFLGKGKVQTVRENVAEKAADLVIFNHRLSPAQERNLERALSCRVLDRTGLILDIFAQRARSFEGKLQVELAQLRHLSTRLVRGWTHLERQKGGIGLRGPGETQLETDRRLVGARIKHITAELEQVRNQRDLHRRARRKAGLPAVSLVGYTNAGKSTVFNRLTSAGVLEANKLFATLDSTIRRIDLGRGRSLLLADTVGFIRHLPHDLVAAFRSTLEETREASLLLHVIDAADAERSDKILQVESVLKEIGAGDVPQVQVYNKVDLAPGAEPRTERDAEGRVRRVWVSARTGAGFDELTSALRREPTVDLVRRTLRLPPSAGRLRAQLHAMGAVLHEQMDAETWIIEVEIEAARLESLCRDGSCRHAPVAGVSLEP